jgi:hypothetical protein
MDGLFDISSLSLNVKKLCHEALMSFHASESNALIANTKHADGRNDRCHGVLSCGKIIAKIHGSHP